MQDILKQLNSEQRKAVEATEGAVMVIAGAGSGKTRVLTYRIAYLMHVKGIDPFNILSLTFTNKAAREMKDRIGKIAGHSEAKNLWMGTFHSVFARILRIEGDKLGYPSNFTIYDTEDQTKVINQVIKELNLDKEIYKTKSVQRRISAFKNGLITPKEYAQMPELQEQDAAARMPMLGDIFKSYNERCFRSGAMDFDDILLNTYMLLRYHPETLAKYQDRFRYIMVDEYQDTNHAQYLIVKALANRHGNICVVGDDAQSIYAFRGANIRNILNYQRDYEEVKVYKLEQNYRSTKNIVGAANSLIKKNKDQLHKEVWTDNDNGNRIAMHKLVSDSDEGNFVARTIWEQHNAKHRAFSEFAILYRTNAQSRAMEDALRRKNIPYRIYGGLSFYQRKEVKDLLAYFRLTINPKDEEAFRRVINFPARGIGTTTMDKLTVGANHAGESLWETAKKLHQHPLGINKPTIGKISDFIVKIESFQSMLDKTDAFELATHIGKSSGLMRELSEDKTPEGVNRYENIQELLNSVKEYADNQAEIEEGDPSLSGFMQDVSLITDADKEEDDNRDRVSLMTIHLAKGLEFPVVFVVGMEENLFPSMLTVNSRADLEEERRLFYVALTRAEQEAFLTYTQMRYRWGKLVDNEPSRFLEEIDERFIDMQVADVNPFSGPEDFLRQNQGYSKAPSGAFERRNKAKSTGASYKTMPPRNLSKLSEQKPEGNFETQTDLRLDQRVKHPRFGFGRIKAVEGEGPNKKAIIHFDNVGEKKLLLKFAKLEKLS